MLVLNQLEQIMFARLLAVYPQASLISDLLQIYEGKFVVRASVQVNGVTRATGMACADHLELAEDRARSRALMVLLPDASSSGQAELSASHPNGMSETQLEMNPSLPLVGPDKKQPRSTATTSAPNSSTISSFALLPTVESSTLTPNGLPELAMENHGAQSAATPVATVAHTEVTGDKSTISYDPQQEFS